MRKVYPSDISREQFAKIEGLLLSARKKTKPRKVDLYDVFCALLYIMKSGCQWSMLPGEFPPKSTVYWYFKQWKEKPDDGGLSLLEQALKKSGQPDTYQRWTQRTDEFLNR